MSRKIKSLITFFFLIQSFSTLAQTSAKNNYDLNSPYSRFGIGDYLFQGSVRNMGMGGTGTSQSHPEFFNIINPALLINNKVTHYDSLLSTLDGSFGAILNTSKDNNGSQTSGSINFNSFSYALPLNKRWTSAIGLRKFSNVSYDIQAKQQISNSTDSALVIFRGTGGIYQADFSNAYKVNKYFNLGLSASYLFGSTNKETLSQVLGQPDSAMAGLNNRIYYNGILLKPGFVVRFPINKAHSRDSLLYFNIGATYEFFTNVSANNRLLSERRTQYNVLLSETIISDINQKLSFPKTFRGGISLDKGYKWNVAADFSYANYNGYKGTSSNEIYKNSYSIFLGGEFSYIFKKEIREGGLEQEKNKRRQYFRAGLMYSKTPLFVNNTQLNDFAITLGYTMQLGKASKTIVRPKLNVALVVGQRGTTKNLLVKDQYYKLNIGITLNEKWFRRKKIE